MDNIVSIALGVIFIIIGFINRTGNISTLHSYHRNKVTEEDKLPYGKLVGLGMIIIGVSLICFGVLHFLAGGEQNVYQIAGSIVLGAGLIAGIGITFYAMFKYNKGIF